MDRLAPHPTAGDRAALLQADSRNNPATRCFGPTYAYARWPITPHCGLHRPPPPQGSASGLDLPPGGPARVADGVRANEHLPGLAANRDRSRLAACLRETSLAGCHPGCVARIGADGCPPPTPQVNSGMGISNRGFSGASRATRCALLTRWHCWGFLGGHLRLDVRVQGRREGYGLFCGPHCAFISGNSLIACRTSAGESDISWT